MDAMADQCLAAARLMIKRYAEAKPDAVSYAGLQQPLNRAWARIVAGHTEKAKQAIRGGVRSLAKPGNDARLSLHLESAAAMLRGNLRTVARTMLFQAAHRTQRAVTRPLGAT